ncbi:MAG: hypothetical protein WBA93_05510 [Microcoleaceae cyanobacterium]
MGKWRGVGSVGKCGLSARYGPSGSSGATPRRRDRGRNEASPVG